MDWEGGGSVFQAQKPPWDMNQQRRKRSLQGAFSPSWMCCCLGSRCSTLAQSKKAETVTAPGGGKLGGWHWLCPQQAVCTACPGGLCGPGVTIPAASAADSWLSQLWGSHPSDPGVHWGRQWVPGAASPRAVPACCGCREGPMGAAASAE